jgi:hypothetical protein
LLGELKAVAQGDAENEWNSEEYRKKRQLEQAGRRMPPSAGADSLLSDEMDVWALR